MKPITRARVLSVLLLIALLISLGLNFLLFTRGDQYYHQLNQVRLDPAGLSMYPTEQNSGKPAGQTKWRVIFLGDSRAAMWTAPTDLEAFEFVNRGIGGETSAQTLARYDAHVKPLDGDILVLQVGINDLKVIPLFPDWKDEIISGCKANIHAIVQKALAEDMKVVLTTIIPEGQISLERRLFWSEDVKKSLDAVNDDLTLLTGEQVILYNTNEILADSQGLVQQDYRKDFLHLNERGYAALNEGLAKVLLALISR